MMDHGGEVTARTWSRKLPWDMEGKVMMGHGGRGHNWTWRESHDGTWRGRPCWDTEGGVTTGTWRGHGEGDHEGTQKGGHPGSCGLRKKTHFQLSLAQAQHSAPAHPFSGDLETK